MSRTRGGRSSPVIPELQSQPQIETEPEVEIQTEIDVDVPVSVEDGLRTTRPETAVNQADSVRHTMPINGKQRLNYHFRPDRKYSPKAFINHK